MQAPESPVIVRRVRGVAISLFVYPPNNGGSPVCINQEIATASAAAPVLP